MLLLMKSSPGEQLRKQQRKSSSPITHMTAVAQSTVASEKSELAARQENETKSSEEDAEVGEVANEEHYSDHINPSSSKGR
jgi:hypothetical protein